jgi:hypothetical protein
MAGLLDWLDIFGPEAEKQKEPSLHALPAPKGSLLPALRPEERGLIQRPEQRTLKEKFLSIFDVFGPSEGKESSLPVLFEEKAQPLTESEKQPWDVMFQPSAEEEAAAFEMFQPSSPSEGRFPKYQFVRQGIPAVPYEGTEWGFPDVQQMAEHISGLINLDRVFMELGESRSTEGYQERLADAAFRGIPLYTPISIIDNKNFYTDFSEFYGIPWQLVEQVRSPEDFKREFLAPLGAILTEAFEMVKPEYLPGFFTVDYNSQDGKYWLYYVEPWLGRIPGP